MMFLKFKKIHTREETQIRTDSLLPLELIALYAGVLTQFYDVNITISYNIQNVQYFSAQTTILTKKKIVANLFYGASFIFDEYYF